MDLSASVQNNKGACRLQQLNVNLPRCLGSGEYRLFDKTCLGFRSCYMWRIMHSNQLFFFLSGVYRFFANKLLKSLETPQKYGVLDDITLPSTLPSLTPSTLPSCANPIWRETVSWHHVCHGIASPITRPQPNWATRNWTVMSIRSVQPVWIIFGQSFRRLGVIYQVNVWINWQLGCPDYAEL